MEWKSEKGERSIHFCKENSRISWKLILDKNVNICCESIINRCDDAHRASYIYLRLLEFGMKWVVFGERVAKKIHGQRFCLWKHESIPIFDAASNCIDLNSYWNCIFILIFYIFVESIEYWNNNNNNNLDNVNFQRKLIKSYNVLCERISYLPVVCRNCRLKGWLNSFGRIINVKESTTRYHRFQRYIIHNRNRAIRNHLFPWTLFT